MALKKFLMVAFVAAVLVACGDDSSSATDSDEVSSSSACEDCDDSSSSKTKSSSSVKKSSSSSAKVKSSSSKARSSSSSAKSSSSSAKSSSSATSSSSSLVGRIPCDINTDEDCFKDERDDQTYKTVSIGTQIWMAENLNYAYTGVPFKYVFSTDSKLVYYSDSTSWCYGYDAANCAKYGRLYTWAAAMDSVGEWSTNGKGCGWEAECSPTYPVRGICPEGWHLPDTTEWHTLFTAVGGKSTAGKRLKSTSGWNSSGNGTDAYAFSALPVGRRDINGKFDDEDEGGSAAFWSSTEDNSFHAYGMFLYYNYDNASLYNDGKYRGISVRCLKDLQAE